MLTRRQFIGALAAVVAAPRMLANLRTAPLRYEEMPLGLLDVIGTDVTPYQQWNASGPYSAGPPLSMAMLEQIDAKVRASSIFHGAFA